MAHLLRGDRLLREGRPDAAKRDYEAALTYPANLGSGIPYHDDQGAHIYYKLGLASRAAGDTVAASSWFGRSVASRNPLPWSDRNYYQGMALRCLGYEKAAMAQFEGLIRAGTARFADGRWYDFFSGYQEGESVESQQSTARLEIGLGRLGIGDMSGARNEFHLAVRLNLCNVWALTFLENSNVPLPSRDL
jgi:tetratricopeptide (TPR) repeat protein